MNFEMERFFGGLDGAGLCDVSQSLGFVLCTVASSSSYRWCCKPKSISSERLLMILGEPRFLYFFSLLGLHALLLIQQMAQNNVLWPCMSLKCVCIDINELTGRRICKCKKAHLYICAPAHSVTQSPLGVCARAHLCTCMCVSKCVCQAGLVSLKERLILPVSICSLCRTESHNLKWTVSCMEIHWRGLL